MIPEDTIKLVSEFTKVILDEPSPEILLSHIAMKTLSSLDCRGAILGVIHREGFLDLVGTYGYEDKDTDKFKKIPLWTPMPITDAARTGEISIFRTPKELVEKYPLLSEYGDAEQGVTVSAPIKYRNSVVGAIGFTSMRAPRDGFDRTSETETILALCGLYVRNLINAKEEVVRDYSTTAQALTPRQKKIIALFEDHLTTDEIADLLRFSASTIKQDIIKIYNLFGVNSRSEVIALAKRAGITGIAEAN